MKDKELKVEDVKVEVDLQKPRNLSVHESWEGEDGEGVGLYSTLLQSDKLQSYGRSNTGTRPVGVELHKKTKRPEWK